MNLSGESWELLRAYGMDDSLVSAWCKGLSVEEAATRLRADLGSATPCTWERIEDGLDPASPREGVVWIGAQAPGWVLIIAFEGDHLALPEPQRALTANGGELIYLGWPLYEMEGPQDLEYVVDGRPRTSVCLVAPRRAGRPRTRRTQRPHGGARAGSRQRLRHHLGRRVRAHRQNDRPAVERGLAAG
ncbi:hypothetical protein GCM10020001_035260 [Nonomuraea salmonea]